MKKPNKQKIIGIHKVRWKLADGSYATYYYDRYTGMKLHGEFGSLEFLESLAASRGEVKNKDEGTLGGIIRIYCASQAYQKLAPSSKQARRYRLKPIEEEYGSLPYIALTGQKFRKHFIDFITKKAIEHPCEADSLGETMCTLLNFAVKEGEIDKNILNGLPTFYKSKRSEIIWSAQQIEAFLSHAPIEMKWAMGIALCTGQRRGDILSLTWGSYDGSAIRLRQGKTGAIVYIPCVQPLRAMLDTIPRRATVILTQKSGRAWRGTTFNKIWNDTCKAAGIEGLHFHDLRGTAVTWLAEAGCKTTEIATITGHSLNNCENILGAYFARTNRIAETAMAKFENRMKINFVK